VRHLHGLLRRMGEGHESRPRDETRAAGHSAGRCWHHLRAQAGPIRARNFILRWAAGRKPVPEEFKPDRLGVLIIPVRWRTKTAYILRSAGRDPDEALLAGMREFSLKPIARSLSRARVNASASGRGNSDGDAASSIAATLCRRPVAKAHRLIA